MSSRERDADTPPSPAIPPPAESFAPVAGTVAPILLVDDNSANLLTFETILAELGEPIVRASSGSDALRQVLAGDFAVIVLDVNLPDMTGFETAALIRQRKRSQHTPIIFVSAISVDEAHAFRGYSMGGVDYIFAPTVPEVLRTKVRVFVELYKQRREVHRQAEQLRELREREHRRAMLETSERLRLALSAGRMGIWEADLSTRQILWSPTADGIAGQDPSRFWTTLEQFSESLSQSSRSELDLAIDRCRREGADLQIEPSVSIAGSTAWLEIRARLISEQGGDRLVGVYSDISDRKRAEQEIRDARDQAQEANRAKDRFLATLSHELRTPLTPVLLAAQSWSHDPTLPIRLRADLSMIVGSIEAESRLIDDLLDLTNISRDSMVMNPKSLDAHEIIQLALRAVRDRLKEPSLSLQVSLAAERHQLFADPVRLQQIVWNIVGNAIKFSPDRGAVLLRTSNDPLGRFILEVEDQGIGIPKDYLCRVFDAFEKAPTERQMFGGLGLGLAICRKIVQLHGGEIEAKSEGFGAGTTIRVAMPVESRPARPDPVAVETRPDATGVRILLVEDHPNTAEVLARLLALNDHHVHVAGSVQEAIDVFSRGEFDLIVSDLGLPDGTGIDLLVRLRATSAVPAIALTGYGQPDDVRRSREGGFAAHLTKPVDLEALQAVINRIVNCVSS